MKTQCTESYKTLFEVENVSDFKKVFPLVGKCIEFSSDETEVLRAIEISLDFGLKILPLNQLEEAVFQNCCPAAKTLLQNKFKTLESLSECLDTTMNSNTMLYQLLNDCSFLLSCFNKFFIELNEYQNIKALEIDSLLLNTVNMLHICYCHCNASERIYGKNFNLVTEYLSSCFKNCCKLQESILNIIMSKLTFEFKNNVGEKSLIEIMIVLSKCGNNLKNLDVKIMAKVWKAVVCLAEKYYHQIKHELQMDNIVNCLCENIIFGIEVFFSQNDVELGRNIKLACFHMKLIIKFCEVFSECLKNCEKSLFNLLISLIWCNISLAETECNAENKDLINQLTFGVDPLLTHLLCNKVLIKEFDNASKELKLFKSKLEVFPILWCLILKKLMHQKKEIRNLWLNKDLNILKWLFLYVSFDKYNVCKNKKLSNLVISSSETQQKKFNGLYEYIMTIMAAFIMTSTAEEYVFIEKQLLLNVVQPNPLCALLAIDIWCILARFTCSDLCYSQVVSLNKMLQLFQSNTYRVEKWNLMLLIYRIIPLLSKNHKELVLETYNKTFSSRLYCINTFNKNFKFDLYLYDEIKSPLGREIEKVNDGFDDFVFSHLERDSDFFNKDSEKNEKLLKWVVKSWKFDFTIISCSHYHESYIKLLSSNTAIVLSKISSQDLLMILCKMREILLKPITSNKLYFMRILKALSLITIPSDDFHENIIENVSEIYAALLLSKNVIVKQKALESFYSFSHVTCHPKIISLSVQCAPDLKLQLTNYFQKKLCEVDNNSEDFIYKLLNSNFEHKCAKLSLSKTFTDSNKNFSTAQSNLVVITRWKKDGESIIQNMSGLTDLEKNEIKALCRSIINVL